MAHAGSPHSPAVYTPHKKGQAALWQGAWKRIMDLIYPPVCRGCGGDVENADEFLCQTCWHKIEYLTDNLCARCGAPQIPGTPLDACAYCPPDWPDGTVLRSAVIYKEPVQALVHGLKFRGHQVLAAPLAQMLRWGFQRHFGGQQFDAIVPVPLHRRREWKREYNQSWLLAESLAKATGIPVAPKTLLRWKNTRPQTSLSGERRLFNVAGAFRVTDSAAFENRRLLIVDDVVTTGSTIAEIVRVLQKAGARHVSALSAARAV